MATKCEVCHKKRKLTRHHKYSRPYIKNLGVISDQFRDFLRSIQFKICWPCHEELNTLQSKCRNIQGNCYECKFLPMCCYGKVRRN